MLDQPRNSRPLACLLAWVLTACVCQNITRANDRLYPKQGVSVQGEIVELSPAQVTIAVRGKNQVFAMDEVSKITFDDEPTGLDRAREQVRLGQYEQALEELKKISLSGISNPRVREDVQFYRYYCEGRLGLAGNGDTKAAIKGLLAVYSANRNTHHLYELNEMLGELALAVGQPDTASNYFKALLSAPSPDTKAIGVYRLGEVKLAQDKPTEAKIRFQQLVSAQASSPEMARLKSLAEVGLAVCENLAGNSQQALEKLSGMVQKYDSTDQGLFARINNAKGACYLALNQPSRALLSYLQTDLLFFTEAEAHAEALYHLVQLWSQEGQAARAAEARERLISQYASSVWANKLNN